MSFTHSDLLKSFDTISQTVAKQRAEKIIEDAKKKASGTSSTWKIDIKEPVKMAPNPNEYTPEEANEAEKKLPVDKSSAEDKDVDYPMPVADKTAEIEKSNAEDAKAHKKNAKVSPAEKTTWKPNV